MVTRARMQISYREYPLIPVHVAVVGRRDAAVSDRRRRFAAERRHFARRKSGGRDAAAAAADFEREWFEFAAQNRECPLGQSRGGDLDGMIKIGATGDEALS